MSDNVYELFEQQALHSPNNVAVVDDDLEWTYFELSRLAGELAAALLDSGPVAGRPVAVLTGKSIDLIVGLLGTLKAGAVYVPLDPAYPDRRLVELLMRIRPAAIVMHARLQQRVAGLLAQVPVAIVQITCVHGRITTVEGMAEGETTPLTGRVEGRGQPAYIFFTSGSEGRPKGVLGSDRSLRHFVRWEARALDVHAQDRFSQVGAISSDASLKDILVPLSVGARICVPPAESSSGAPLLEWIADSGVSVLGCVPTLFRTLLESAEERPDWAREHLARLRLVLLAGEVLKVAWVQRWMDLFKERIPLANLYGATEATVYSVFNLVTRRPPEGSRTIPVGKGIDGTEVLLINRGGQRCGPGEVGEIFLRSDFLSLGYFDDEPATRAAFVQNPLQLDQPEIVYRTGDSGRCLHTGDLEFIRRNDAQVKILGHRVDLSEVERVLAGHETLREAVADLRESHAGEPRLVAYVMPREGYQPTSSELHRYVKERLPQYLVPTAFVSVPSFPLTHNGKIDRRALPEPSQDRPELLETYAAPRTPGEEIVAAIWAEVLGIHRVGAYDNFFELGGNSLLATQVASRLREAFQLELPLRAVFEQASVAALAAEIERARGSSASVVVPLGHAPRDTDLELSYAQQRLWFLDQLQPNSGLYNIHAALRLLGAIDRGALERSLEAIVLRHESLRTTFAVRDGRPRQIVHPAPELEFATHDLRACDPGEREARIRGLAIDAAKRPFDLERGPLLRVSLLSVDSAEHVMLLAMHHIVSDRWSCEVFGSELAALYSAFVQGEGSPLPPLAIQYPDFARWQRTWLGDQQMDRQLEYWRGRLAGAPSVVTLPSDRPRPPRQTHPGAVIRRTLANELSDGVAQLSRRERVTTFMTLLVAFQVVLHYRTGLLDIVVGTDVANRVRREVEPLIGFFVNQLVLRADLSGDPSGREMLARTRESALGAYGHQDLPFDRLVEALRPERDPRWSPLFQVKLVFQNAPLRNLELPGVRLELLDVDSGAAQNDLNLRIFERDDGLECSAEYNTDLFDHATIERCLDLFELALQGLVARPDDRLSVRRAALAQSDHRPPARPPLVGGPSGRRAVALSAGGLVTLEPLTPGRALPLVVRPNVAGVELVAWARANRALVRARLLEHGGLLFRDFGVSDPGIFERLVATIADDLLEYRERSSPRSQVGEHTYTSTDHPADQSIYLHNESSYAHTWPLTIAFCCLQPAERGGETPIADCRAIYRRLSPELRARFASRRVMYVRNFGGGFGLPWQTVFQTSNRAQVEAYCRQAGLQLEWLGESRLRTRRIGDATRLHPRTGEPVWFNHATFFHVSTLDPALGAALRAGLADDELPNQTFYGDGSPIEPEVLDTLRDAYRHEMVMFDWRQGDVLLLDNMLTAHGRAPYSGARKVIVAMAEPTGEGA